MCRSSETPIDRMRAALGEMPAWLSRQSGSSMGEVAIQLRQIIDRTQAYSAEAIRRFEKSGGYRADGALGIVPWLRDKTKVSGGVAAEHVEVGRQLEQLPRTEEALQRGEIGYQHAVAIARSADHVGAASVRKAEATLLKAAETMDAGQFSGVVKNFEHQVDGEAALQESNRAYARRYLSISEPINGLARIEGQLVAEAVASLRSAIEPFMKPTKGDERTAGQRAHDALMELCRRSARGRGDVAGVQGDVAGRETAAPRTLLVVTASVDTLAGIPGAPAGELQGGGMVPAETVRRIACDTAVTRITGLGDLKSEQTNAARTIPPSTRRILIVRDRHCVFPGCDRPAPWCEGHHLIFWADGGETNLDNLGLVCGPHHRKVHEEGWTLRRNDGRWIATPPALKVEAHARSA